MTILHKYFGDKELDKQRHWVFVIIALVIVGSRGFNYVNWPFGNVLFASIIALLSIVCVINNKYFCKQHFKTIVLLFMILPFLSIINSSIIYDQSVLTGLRANFSMAFVWIMYFILHIFKVKEKYILKALLYIGSFIAIVMIIQQFTYPYAFFGVITEEGMVSHGLSEIADMRNGLWRFRMNIDMYYTAPILFFLLTMIKQKRYDTNIMFYFVLFLVSVYLSLTRQVIFATIFTIIFSFFINNKKLNIGYYVLLLLFGVLMYFNYDVLFGELSEQTSGELNNDNIRVYAATYLWNDSFNNISTFLFGNGLPGEKGMFHNYVERLQDMGIYVVDVGFIGMTWRYGFLYVILSYYLLFHIFFKLKSEAPMYIRLFVVFVFVMSIMIFPFGAQSIMTMVWPLLLYICDLRINKSQFALQTL